MTHNLRPHLQHASPEQHLVPPHQPQLTLGNNLNGLRAKQQTWVDITTMLY